MRQRPKESSMTRHTTKTIELDPNGVTVRFDDNVLPELRHLEKLTRGQKDFDSDLYAVLDSMASGKLMDIAGAFSALMCVTQEAATFAARHNVREMSATLSDLHLQLMGDSKDARPVAVFAEQRSRRR